MFKKSQEDSIKAAKIYLYIATGVVVLVYIMLWRMVIPKLLEIFREIPGISAEAIEKRLLYLSVGSIVFIFLINFFFTRKLNQLEEEKRKILTTQPHHQEKLKAIEKQIRFYLNIIEPLIIIILSVTVGLLTYIIISPMYSMIGIGNP